MNHDRQGVTVAFSRNHCFSAGSDETPNPKDALNYRATRLRGLGQHQIPSSATACEQSVQCHSDVVVSSLQRFIENCSKPAPDTPSFSLLGVAARRLIVSYYIN